MQPRKNAWQADDEQRHAEELPVQRQRHAARGRCRRSSAGTISSSPRASSTIPGLKHEEVGAVDEHRPQVDPRRLPRREPARALVVAEPALAVLEEA